MRDEMCARKKSVESFDEQSKKLASVNVELGHSAIEALNVDAKQFTGGGFAMVRSPQRLGNRSTLKVAQSKLGDRSEILRRRLQARWKISQVDFIIRCKHMRMFDNIGEPAHVAWPTIFPQRLGGFG